jgi:L-2-hydroxyglutarate oxidase LhgO
LTLSIQPNWQGDVAIVGGGIIGLATAREILLRRPGTRLIVLERESQIATHQTGHNSGVIHAGIYYKPGTLKAKLCVAGAAALMHYCDEKSIPYRLCGKMIVATDESELGRLSDLYERATANGVQGVRMVDGAELSEREPHVRGLRALWSPNTGIVDYVQVAHAYADDIVEAGGEIRTDAAVTAIERCGALSALSTSRATFVAPLVVTCAGIYSDRVSRMTGGSKEPLIAPFRGDYFVLRPERRSLVASNIYPVPDPAFPFLGVHFTPRMNGDIWLGPNAVLAFSRTGYRFRDVNLRDMAQLWTSPGFLRFGLRNLKTGYDEMIRDLSKRRFLASLQRYVPELTLDDLLPGPSGVRAQALTTDGHMVDDFVINHGDGILHVRNAPSPAATSSLKIAEYIADQLGVIDPRFATRASLRSSRAGEDELL